MYFLGLVTPIAAVDGPKLVILLNVGSLLLPGFRSHTQQLVLMCNECDLQAVNIVLRLAWISSIQQVTSVRKGISSAGWDISFAALEVIRRGHWNFYRYHYIR